MFCVSTNLIIGERAPIPQPIPQEIEWYHGRLDRYSAEQRLKAAYKLGSYLGKKIHLNRPTANYSCLQYIFFFIKKNLITLELFMY